MAKLLSEEDASAVKKFFDGAMANPVTLRVFVQDPDQPGDCPYCAETEQILREISELHDQVQVVVHKSPTEGEMVKQYNIERVPAIIIEGEKTIGSGVRFYGIPSGYEFGILLEDIVDVSNGTTKLSPEIIKQVEKVQQDVTIKVFVTPT